MYISVLETSPYAVFEISLISQKQDDETDEEQGIPLSFLARAFQFNFKDCKAGYMV